MVSFGRVDTGKSNIQREKRRREKGKNNFTIKLMAGVKNGEDHEVNNENEKEQ